MRDVVNLKDVTKVFGRFKALKGISLSVKDGEKLAILGPNGAGKTTLIKIISGQSKPTTGEVSVYGFTPWKYSEEVRKKIGVVSHNLLLYEDLTAYENLQFFSKLYEVDESRIGEVLKEFGLYSRRHDLVKNYSRGMKQRLSIARAVLHDPQLLILDEPSTGLDYQGRLKLMEMLESYGERRTVILTTHNIEEAERLCRKVAIINEGRLLSYGEVEGIESLAEFYLKIMGGAP
jgi:ABC-type multidrug transport system ATPase subunit